MMDFMIEIMMDDDGDGEDEDEDDDDGGDDDGDDDDGIPCMVLQYMNMTQVEFGSHREAERAVSELDERWRRISGHVKLCDTFHTEGHSGIGIQLVAT
jgi:hypothetical protein